MNAEVFAAVVFLVIFVVGVTVGIIAVVALSAVRRERQLRRPAPAELDDEIAGQNTGASGVPGHWDRIRSDERPQWPSDTDSEYSG